MPVATFVAKQGSGFLDQKRISKQQMILCCFDCVAAQLHITFSFLPISP
jgi:hypothetical protein